MTLTKSQKIQYWVLPVGLYWSLFYMLFNLETSFWVAYLLPFPIVVASQSLMLRYWKRECDRSHKE